MEEEIEIQIKNREAELSGLRLECLDQASNLTSILISVDSAKKELIDINASRLEFDEHCVRTRTELKDESARITADKMNLVGLKETSSKDLTRLKDDIKIANKELSWVNDKVLKARLEGEEIKAFNTEALKELSKLNTLVEMIPQMQTEILSLEEKRDKIKIEISEMADASIGELTKAKDDLRKITEEVEKKIEEANQAEYRCKRYVDELYTHMNDYQVVRSRLESIWNRTFPELDLKI